MNKTTPLIIVACVCVIALALLTLDVPGIVVVALLGIPVSVSAYRCIQTVFEHEAALDALLAAWHARWQSRGSGQRAALLERAYTGETVKLDEVPR